MSAFFHTVAHLKVNVDLKMCFCVKSPHLVWDLTPKPWLSVCVCVYVCMMSDRLGCQRQGLATRVWPFSCHPSYTSSYGGSLIHLGPHGYQFDIITNPVFGICVQVSAEKQKLWVTVTSVEMQGPGLQSSYVLVSCEDCHEWLSVISKPSVWPQRSAGYTHRAWDTCVNLPLLEL